MPDLLTQLAEIRARQGLEPIPDPRIIQGFGDGSDPPPPFPTFSQPTHTNPPDPYDDPEDEPATFRSPLVEAARPAPAVFAQSQEVVLPKFELIVCDTAAGYRGHQVELSQQERGEVIGVVLKALQRHIEEQLAEVRAMGTRVKTAAPGPIATPPRKRGRPRKVRP